VTNALDRPAVVELLRDEMTSRLAALGFDKRFIQTSARRLGRAPLHALEASDVHRSSPSERFPPHASTPIAEQVVAGKRHPMHAGEHVHDVRWDEYAEAYDVMCAANPAYQENVALFRGWLDGLTLPRNARICDVGAGTGNYVLELARRFPDAQIVHVDRDPVMNRSAARKYQAYGIANVSFVASNAFEVGFAPATLDAIVCVNALYAFDDIDIVLREYHSWLKPDGQLFLIDLGREMRVGDWFRYIVGASMRAFGLRTTLSYLLRGRKAVPQNRLIRREQHSGRYWLHSPEQFQTALKDAGFEILRTQTCYRNVCDLAVCRRGAALHDGAAMRVAAAASPS
jgi:ubiquinone/menaquinone biosynthesis C-methylase UbiE